MTGWAPAPTIKTTANGARVAGAETALDSLHSHFKKAATAQNQLCQQEAPNTVEAWRHVEIAMHECISSSGGFRLFGGRSKTRLLRNFLDKLSHYAHIRVIEELNGAARQCFNTLIAKLADRLRDLGFCRQRLRHLQENLDRPTHEQEEELNGTVQLSGERTLGRSPPPSTESFLETIRQSDTARVVLPNGQDDLEQAALTFLLYLKPEQWQQLDRELHEKVLEPHGGLNGACMNDDLTRQMAVPLLEGATKFLNLHLPIMDVAQIIKNEAEAGESAIGAASESSLREQTEEYLQRSASPWLNKQGKGRHQFLWIPASNADKGLSESVLDLFPELRLVRVAGQSDLMFLCEQGEFTYEDLMALLKPCRAAYEGAATAPVSSPHARFDFIDWLPLEPRPTACGLALAPRFPGLLLALRCPPNLRQQLMNLRLLALQLRAVEREEVVHSKERLGHLGEEFFLVRQRVVFGLVAVDVQDAFIFFAFAKPAKGGGDFGMVEAEHLVVISMCEFVQHRPRLHALMVDARPLGRHRNMNAAGEFLRESVRLEPALARMVLRGTKLAVRLVEPDRHLLQLLDLLGWYDVLDVVEPIGEQAQRVIAKLLVGIGQQAVVDVDRPAFDVALGVRGRDRRRRFYCR
ncbi:MAG: hypothetical protein EXR98_17925 [Gemmataceae bacterium]|nr:hypothetical protein [Gemmataceae bacterium]